MTLPRPPTQAADSPRDGDRVLTDFTANTPDLGWHVVNDNVMGGRSEGSFEREQTGLRFYGRTNTNGGGFSSIRTGPLEQDLSMHTGIQIFVKGDGRRYTWRLSTPQIWRGRAVSYWSEFGTNKDTWTRVNLPFSSFVARMRGNQLDDYTLDLENITGMGLMIYDRQDGPFELRLANVQTYSTRVRLEQFRWQQRVLILSAPAADDHALVEQLRELAATSPEFVDRDMVSIILLEDGLSAVDDRRLSARDAADIRATLDLPAGSFALRLIGKDGGIKLSRSEATAMNDIYALIDGMPMRRAEQRSR